MAKITWLIKTKIHTLNVIKKDFKPGLAVSGIGKLPKSRCDSFTEINVIKIKY